MKFCFKFLIFYLFIINKTNAFEKSFFTNSRKLNEHNNEELNENDYDSQAYHEISNEKLVNLLKSRNIITKTLNFAAVNPTSSNQQVYQNTNSFQSYMQPQQQSQQQSQLSSTQNLFLPFSEQFFKSFGQPQSLRSPSQSFATRAPVFKLDNTAACGVVKPKVRKFVANGEPTEDDTWPWHVQLHIAGNNRSDSETYCGGTLISKKYILTAAHCYDDLMANKRARNTMVLFKGVEITNPKFLKSTSKTKTDNFYKIRASKVHLHPQYVPAMTESEARLKKVTPGPIFDLALIEIRADSQELYDNLLPICLPDETTQLKVGTKCKIMGHGFMNARDEDFFIMPSILQMADVTLSSNQACKDEVESQSIKSKINSDTICIRGPIHPCVGDSGGPLLCHGSSSSSIEGESNDDNYDDYEDSAASKSNKKWHLMGVTSFAVSTDDNDKCGQFKSAVFAKVSNVRQWIKSFVGF